MGAPVAPTSLRLQAGRRAGQPAGSQLSSVVRLGWSDGSDEIRPNLDPWSRGLGMEWTDNDQLTSLQRPVALFHVTRAALPLPAAQRWVSVSSTCGPGGSLYLHDSSRQLKPVAKSGNSSHPTSPHPQAHTPSVQVLVQLTMASNYRRSRSFEVEDRHLFIPTALASGNHFLTQLMSINMRSREFPNTLTQTLAYRESINAAMSMQGDDALALVEILDQVSRPGIVGVPQLTPVQAFEAPNMELDLRRKSVRILRRVCGSETILPRSCILSENISKEGDIAFTSGGFADVWKGCHDGKLVCIKAFRAYTAENLSKIKQVCGRFSYV